MCRRTRGTSSHQQRAIVADRAIVAARQSGRHFNIESDSPGSFSEEDRQFAEIFGRYVAIALHILDLMVVERHATTGRLADNVSSEVGGPLSDILSDATALMEDYIGHDDLRHRLQCIVDNVDKIRALVRQVGKPTGGSWGPSRPIRPRIPRWPASRC